MTDADLALGFIDPKFFAEKRVKLRPRESARAIKARLGTELGLTVRECAYGISQMVDENMANAARVHAVEHGTEISNRTMIAFGGNGPLHATRLAEKVGVTQIIVPPDPGVGSAVGFLSAPISYELIRSLYTLLSNFDDNAVHALLAEMQVEARSVVRAGAPGRKLVEQRMAFMRYEGQGHELEVVLPSGRLPEKLGGWLHQRFEKMYEAQFGRAVPNVDIEVMSWGVVAATPTDEKEAIAAPRATRKPRAAGKRKIYWGQSRRVLEVPFHERGNLVRGDRIAGPALIVEAQTTTLVGPEFDAVIDAVGNIVMNRRKTRGSGK